MSRLLRRRLELAATGVALAAPSLILPPTDLVRRDKSIIASIGKQDALPLDALFAAGHMAPGMMGLASGGSGPPPTFVAVSANGNGTSAAMPSGWAAGDLLVIVAAAYKIGSSTTGHNTPAGWALLDSYTHNFSSTYQTRVRVFYRIAQSGDSTVTLTSSDGSTGMLSCMLAYRGANAASPFEATSVTSNQSAASSIPYAEIEIGANRVVLQIISNMSAGDVSATPGASWTERIDMWNFVGLSIDERTFSSAGTTPAGNQAKSGSYQWGRMAFAIKPA